MSEYVSISGLKKISSKLNYRKKQISDIFNEKLLITLNQCSSYLETKYFELELEEYNKIFNDINRRLSVLSDLLNYGIINDYKETVDNINSLFNNDFKSKYNELMNKDVKE